MVFPEHRAEPVAATNAGSAGRLSAPRAYMSLTSSQPPGRRTRHISASARRASASNDRLHSASTASISASPNGNCSPLACARCNPARLAKPCRSMPAEQSRPIARKPYAARRWATVVAAPQPTSNTRAPAGRAHTARARSVRVSPPGWSGNATGSAGAASVALRLGSASTIYPPVAFQLPPSCPAPDLRECTPVRTWGI